MIIATDLDQTLIYSRRAMTRWGGSAEALAAVETYQDVDSSFMTASAAATFAHLQQHAVVVPVTTRTPEQLARVRLPGGPTQYAVAANGGVLLVDGVPDDAWARVVAAPHDAAPLAEVYAHALATCAPGWTKLVRTASELFCYAVLDRAQLPAGFADAEAGWAAERGWRVSLQGRKLYWVPAWLRKSAAVDEIATRRGGARVVAAGDSLLDQDLLEAADAGIMARHGELAASGWTAPHVEITTALGLRAGAEIVDWLTDQLTSRGDRGAQSRQPSSIPSGTTSPGS